MSRKAFHLLLKRYLDGTCSAQERDTVNQWYELLGDEELFSNQTEDLSVAEDRIWQRIQEKIESEKSPAIFKKERHLSALPKSYKWIAAILIPLVVITLFALNRKPETSTVTIASFHLPQDDNFYIRKNNTSSLLLIKLADGSLVRLQPGAMLSCPKQFAASKREVYLDGGASFSVTKNPARPFLVYTGAIVTQVLGTSFTIKKENNRFEVAVLTGKVAVYEEDNKQLHDKGGVVITPNEKVTYYSDNHHFITALVDRPVIVEEKAVDSTLFRESFSFDETPVTDVINRLQKAYAVQIIPENDKINHCLFSGNLSGESLYNMLDLICGAIGSDYEIRGTSIILTGNGCD